MGLLLLPNHPEFYKALDDLPLPLDFDPSKCIIQRLDSLLPEAVSSAEAIEYALGGELDLLDDDLKEDLEGE